VSILRVFSVLGPSQRRLLPFELWQQAVTSEQVTLRGTGSESRDFLHVEDLANALLALLDRPGQPLHEVLNLASGVETTTGELAAIVRSLFAPQAEILFLGKESPENPLRWCADIGRLREVLPSWQPRSVDLALEQCGHGWARADS
jgi:nucleoside-diphosphate-sugar epimerase